MVTLEQLYDIYRQYPDICTDSRRVRPGCLFWALRGERFDGNCFAAQALQSGAAYCVVDRADAAPNSDKRLQVPDTLEALQLLAAHHRRQLDIPVIAIGGSNGKTTTKELIAAVLNQQYTCCATQGNLNNHIGVPLTLLSIPQAAQIAVVEMGTNQPGDLEQLCAIAQPTHGLLTNIGKEHLEKLGSLQGVKKAEAELFDYLARRDGCAFINLSERHLRSLARSVKKKVFYAEVSPSKPLPKNVLGVERLPANPFVRAQFTCSPEWQIQVQTHLLGHHNFHNVMTAIAVGLYFKVSPTSIKTAIESYRPANNRSQLLSWESNTIFLDAYNANPTSMRAALSVLQEAEAKHKVAILGDMLELGEAAEVEHRALIRLVERSDFQKVVFVGPLFSKYRPKRSRALFFDNVALARTWWEQQRFEHAFILIKASRGIGLEQLLEGQLGETLQGAH
ncbi:MAG: UDP-N-acetylmuramoyl-tripeptide--D-alanyl-D-alanine ligase [Saprospiraceae bacterium]|nr:UDP-N-acetylmuramoyl-tripeptide--D-alanyl-D-alanine ligase [Saprospiraceae bacterium]MDW8485004.1 UDP-N-acetylmuramoyl-tripeptide--D-alanyl-D-alanine ligase [Saprospiraceae bacterium]